jgi:hypothetical protein
LSVPPDTILYVSKEERGVEMPLYTFRMHGIDRIIDAFHFEDALKEAGLRKGDEYELIEEEDLEYGCFLSAIDEDMLFGL